MHQDSPHSSLIEKIIREIAEDEAFKMCRDIHTIFEKESLKQDQRITFIELQLSNLQRQIEKNLP